MMPCSSPVPLRALATLVVAALTASCGSRPQPGLWDGSFGTGSCGAGSTGQFTCTPDRGSFPADCAAAERGLALYPLGDFTQETAAKFYVYTDKSGQGRVSSFDKGWEPSTVADPFPRCTDGSAPRALHIQGGPFYGWGGGIGTSAKDWSGFPAPSDLPSYLGAAAIDASGYEGVALWARRGPDSQGGLRVLVGDIDTDDDISYLTYVKDPALKRNCERVRECACTNHKACQRWDTDPLHMQTPNLKAWSAAVTDELGTNVEYQMWSCRTVGSYCEDPAADTVPGYFTTGGMTTRCNTCAETRCDERYEAYPDQSVGDAKADAQFYRKPCTPYTFRSGVSSAFCFDPGKDPPPAEQDEQCGDHWTSPVYLTDQWQLYLVPFSEMLQQGWAKRFAKLDTRHVTLVRLTWDGGYVDYWVAWVGFYRRAG